jgi:glycosyltransferase involved in cell wall biosynthesis
VDTARLEPSSSRATVRRSLRIPGDAHVVASIGALVWEKDPATHLAVSERVLARHPDAVHLFVGDGPLRSEMERRVRELPAADRIRMVGPRDDVGDVLRASDVVLFASRADGMEGMPAIVIEAGICGRPVVGYAVAGVPEVVIDGETGILVAPGDRGGLVRGVARIVEDPELGRTLGRAAEDRCRPRYDVRVVAEQYRDLYSELVG